MTDTPTSPRDKRFTFGQHLRAQRLAGIGKPPAPDTEPPSIFPVIRAEQHRSHIQREAAARLRELQQGQV